MSDKKYKMIDGQLVEMTADEVEDFMASLAQFRRKLPKSTVMSRLIAKGKAGVIRQAFNANPAAEFKWSTPDWPEVYVDDQDLLAFLSAIGMSQAEIDEVLA